MLLNTTIFGSLSCLLFVTLIGYAASSPPQTLLYCEEGTYLKPGTGGHPDSCEPCPNGFFNSKSRHRQRACQACTLYDKDDPYVRDVRQECNGTDDAKVICLEGFYFSPDSSSYSSCVRCTDCTRLGQFEAQACEWNNDAKCCPKDTQIIINGSCTDLPAQCGLGEDASTDEDTGYVTCRLRPEIPHPDSTAGDGKREKNDTLAKEYDMIAGSAAKLAGTTSTMTYLAPFLLLFPYCVIMVVYIFGLDRFPPSMRHHYQ